jgi:D-methionine transport system permease protein
MAITYGMYKKKFIVEYTAVILLVIMVQVFQSVGTRLTVKSDKRINKSKIRRKKQ